MPKEPIEYLKILVASFGNPKNEKIYSGVPMYLSNAIKKHAKVVAYLNTKQLRPLDVFDGAIDFSKTFKYGRPGISRKWLWRPKTVDKLSARFKRLLSRAGDFNTVLQMGTHVRVTLDGTRHYCRTDMTVAQAVEAGRFGMDNLGIAEIKEAIAAQKSIFETCDGIFVTSNWVKQSIVNDYGVDTSKIHITGAGASISLDVDIDEKQPNFSILFVGRDWERKGGPLLLDAFRKIVRRIPQAKLTIIGCSPNISEENVEALGVLDKKHRVQRRVIDEAYRNATVLCVPSLFEPFGMCWLEAQLYGVIPVTFTGEGRGEAIRNGLTGILVKERSSDALSKVVIELLENPDETRKMGIAGHEFVMDNFTWDNVAQKVLRVMESNKNNI